jgi:hypothetical protein
MTTPETGSVDRISELADYSLRKRSPHPELGKKLQLTLGGAHKLWGGWNGVPSPMCAFLDGWKPETATKIRLGRATSLLDRKPP